MTLKIIFAGTPAFALPSLEALATSGNDILAVYTQPDRPCGRGRKLQASVIKKWAQANSIPVHQPLNFKDEKNIEELAGLAPDIMVVIAYGLILPPKVLTIPKYGCINVHASLLPRWRGAAPIQYAILHGDKKTGISIMQMDAGLDTGPVLQQKSVDISPEETTAALHDRLSKLAVEPLLESIQKITSLKPIPQDEAAAAYASKINKEDALINWQESAVEIDRKIRAFNPWPIAFTYIDNLLLKIHEAVIVPQLNLPKPGTIISINKNGMLVATGADALLIKRIQFPGSNIINISDYLNSQKNILAAGVILGKQSEK